MNYGFSHSCFSTKLVQYAFDFQDFQSKDGHPYLFVSTIINVYLFLCYSIIQWFGWDRGKIDVSLIEYYEHISL